MKIFTFGQLKKGMFVLVCNVCFVNMIFAHHSVPGQFDVTKVAEWQGTITEIEWINPHIYIHVDVQDENGSAIQWQLETHPPAFMRKARITKTMMLGKEGETVVITGWPSRDESKHMGYIHKVSYEDGHFYELVRP